MAKQEIERLQQKETSAVLSLKQDTTKENAINCLYHHHKVLFAMEQYTLITAELINKQKQLIRDMIELIKKIDI